MNLSGNRTEKIIGYSIFRLMCDVIHAWAFFILVYVSKNLKPLRRMSAPVIFQIIMRGRKKECGKQSMTF